MLALTLHSTEHRKPNHLVRAKVRSSPMDASKLLLVYEVQGADKVLWPSGSSTENRTAVDEGCFSGKRRDELWKATCFECFLGPIGQENYVEWNFSIDGDWAAYSFKSYRDEMAAATVQPPMFHLPQSEWRKSGRLFLEVEADVPAELRSISLARLQAGLTAVIVEPGQEKPFYWAIEHWREKPDFHARESFTLGLSGMVDE